MRIRSALIVSRIVGMHIVDGWMSRPGQTGFWMLESPTLSVAWRKPSSLVSCGYVSKRWLACIGAKKFGADENASPHQMYQPLAFPSTGWRNPLIGSWPSVERANPSFDIGKVGRNLTHPSRMLPALDNSGDGVLTATHRGITYLPNTDELFANPVINPGKMPRTTVPSTVAIIAKRSDPATGGRLLVEACGSRKYITTSRRK